MTVGILVQEYGPHELEVISLLDMQELYVYCSTANQIDDLYSFTFVP